MTGKLLLVLLILLPFLTGALILWLRRSRPALVPRVSVAAAVLLVLLVSVAIPETSLDMFAQRELSLLPEAQLGIQLLGLAMLGFVLANSGTEVEDEGSRVWLVMAWFSLGGLVLSLLVRNLPIALLFFIGGAMIWTQGLPAHERRRAASATLRYLTLLAFCLPLMLIALRIADLRGEIRDVESVERLALALAVPAFGLILGLIPLHAWVFTLAGKTPRAMVYGVTSLVQTAGFALLLRMLADNPWMTYGARSVLVGAGALSSFLGAWLALSAPRNDPDDWLIYATVSNGGLILVGLGTQSEAAGTGVALMLFARVLALVLTELATQADGQLRRLAHAIGTLTLAGTPGLAGFPGFWLIVRRLQTTDSRLAELTVLAGSGLLFATAVRRWSYDLLPGAVTESSSRQLGIRRAVLLLSVLLVLLGLMPGLVAHSLDEALRKLNMPGP
jgi:formate hydrogenlyase subunit 3/multisubunit Na+/H+ antiporter MnhD subunit